MVEIVTADAFKRALENRHKTLVLDVRTHEERQALFMEVDDWHRPLHEINFDTERDDFAQMGGESGIFIVCYQGSRSQKAAEELEARGLEKVHVVEGGVDACDMAGIQCVRDPQGPDHETLKAAMKDSMQRYMQQSGPSSQ